MHWFALLFFKVFNVYEFSKYFVKYWKNGEIIINFWYNCVRCTYLVEFVHTSTSFNFHKGYYYNVCYFTMIKSELESKEVQQVSDTDEGH